MKKNLLITLCLLVTLFVPIANSECIYPKKSFKLPDGSKASQDEMLETQAKVKNWQAVAETYRKCLDLELAGIPKETDNYEDMKKIIDDKYDSSVIEEKQLAEQDWNTAVQAYNKANKAQ
jgi:hypothetical protein